MAQLDDVAVQLTGLGRRLVATGEGLGVAGANLTEGGQRLSGFASSERGGTKRAQALPKPRD